MDKLKALGLVFYHWLEAMILFFVPRHLRYKDICQEVVLITGAGSGIGRLLAVKLGKLVDCVVLWDIDEARLQETSKEVQQRGGKCKAYVCDLSKRKSIYQTADQVKRDVGPVTVIINNAGIVAGKSLLALTDENIQKTFEVNVLSHFWIIRSFLADMMKNNHGHILSMASVASFVGSSKLTDYCASKAAAHMLHESLFLELTTSGYDGIKTTAICPYLIGTGMFNGANDKVIPMLDPDATADQIIDALRTDQHLMVLPRMFYFLLTLKTILPVRTGYYIYELLGGLEMMNNFSGRNNNVEVNGQKNHVKVN